MGWRGLGVVVLLAVLGAAAGAGVARWGEDGPAAGGDPVPVVAASPALPTTPAVEVLPDPRTPALGTRLRTHRETIGQQPFALSVPVPDGWQRSNSRPGVWTWLVPRNPPNTYVLRISLPSGFSTIDGALEDRIAALDGATGIQEFRVDETTSDAFTASYVLDGHRRVTTERFLSLDGSQTVYAVVAVIGRETDRAGMAALMETVTEGARR